MNWWFSRPKKKVKMRQVYLNEARRRVCSASILGCSLEPFSKLTRDLKRAKWCVSSTVRAISSLSDTIRWVLSPCECSRSSTNPSTSRSGVSGWRRRYVSDRPSDWPIIPVTTPTALCMARAICCPDWSSMSMARRLSCRPIASACTSVARPLPANLSR